MKIFLLIFFCILAYYKFKYKLQKLQYCGECWVLGTHVQLRATQQYSYYLSWQEVIVLYKLILGD